MRLSKSLEQAVRFAAFCVRECLAPREAAELIVLARRAFKAGEANCNEGTAKSREAEQRRANEFGLVAEMLGYTVSWPGLWPLLSRDGQDVYLPEIE